MLKNVYLGGKHPPDHHVAGEGSILAV